MKTRYFVISSLMLCVMMLMTEGCTEKNLKDGAPSIAGNVEVVFDWSKVSVKKPSSMILYLYSDEHNMLDHWFNNPDGGDIRSYAGFHTAVCHSNDDPYVHHIRNEQSHDEIEIFTDNTALLVGQGISTNRIPRAPGTEDEPLRTTPSVIFGAQCREINLKASYLPQKIVLYPEELVCHYSVQFVDVENIKNADLVIDATVSSLAGGFYPGRMTPTAESVTHTFTLTADREMKTLSSEFLTFGLPDGDKRSHLLCLYITLKNRTGNFYTFDVSDQVNNAPDPKNVNIRIFGLKLPDLPDDPFFPPEGEGGVSVEIDSWDTYSFDLQV